MSVTIQKLLGRSALSLASVAALTGAAPASAQNAVHINLINQGGVEPGTKAYDGFTAAAKYWESVLTTADPNVTINFAVKFDHLGPNILGSTRSAFTSRAVQFVEGRLAARQYGAFDAQAVANLPGLSTGQDGVGALSVYTPGYTGYDANGNPFGIDNATKVWDTDGSFNNEVIGLTTANAKALGYTFASGNVDASITFSSDFAFDFRPDNGIRAGASDFYAVAIHEMGHALGFVSGVDDYDVLGTGGPLADQACFADGTLCKDYPANDDWFGETLDLFRYSAPGALDWTTNTASYFSIDGGQTAYQDGLFSTGTYNGDGWQASHWKAPTVVIDGQTFFSCRRPKLGIMNPYICSGREGIVTGLDLSAQDAIGWNLRDGIDQSTYARSTGQIFKDLGGVPEPTTWAMMLGGFGLIGGTMRRRQSVKVSFA